MFICTPTIIAEVFINYFFNILFNYLWTSKKCSGKNTNNQAELVCKFMQEVMRPVVETVKEKWAYPVCVTRSDRQHLPSPPVPHTDCVFWVQADRHQTLERQHKKKFALNHPTTMSLVTWMEDGGHNKKANNGCRPEENSCPAPGTFSISTFVSFSWRSHL